MGFNSNLDHMIKIGIPICMKCSQAVLICLCRFCLFCLLPQPVPTLFPPWHCLHLNLINYFEFYPTCQSKIFFHSLFIYLPLQWLQHFIKWLPSKFPFASPSLPFPHHHLLSFPFAFVLRGQDVCTQTGQSPWISIWECSCLHCSTRPPQSK